MGEKEGRKDVQAFGAFFSFFRAFLFSRARIALRRQISKPEGPPRRQFFASFCTRFRVHSSRFRFNPPPLPPFKRASRGRRGFHGKESIVQPVIVVRYPGMFYGHTVVQFPL